MEVERPERQAAQRAQDPSGQPGAAEGSSLDQPLRARSIFHLHRAVGNQAVQRLLGSSGTRRPPPGRQYIARWGDPAAYNQDAAQQILPAIEASLFQAMASDDHSGFGAELLRGALAALGGQGHQPAPEERAELQHRCDDIAAMEADYDGVPVNIPEALQFLESLHPALASAQVPAANVSYGLTHMLRGMARDASRYLAGAQGAAASTDQSVGRGFASMTLRADLTRLVEVLSNGDSLLALELEGTVAEVIRLRQQLAVEPEQATRASIGQQLGEASRRAMLLNQAMVQARQAEEGDATPLDEQVIRVAGQIQQIREQAQTERATRDALGDTPALLTQQQIDLTPPATADQAAEEPSLFFPEQFDPERPGAAILPEQALPEATDSATTGLMAEMQSRVADQQREVAGLHDRIIPPNPRYDIAEFEQLFRRWFAFFSLTAEQEDPIIKLYLQLMGEPYQLMGSAHLDGVSAIEGGIARSMLMNLAVEQMQNHMGSASADFAGELAGAGLARRSTEASGSASAPEYRYGELYPGRHSLDAGGERSSRGALLSGRSAETADSFSRVASMPAALQPAAAVAEGIAPTAAPITGLRSVEAQEGWSYLIDVTDPLGEEVIAREHRVMPPEVADYLLARRQQQATLQSQHTPTVGGAPIGDLAMRANGVEGGEGSSVARYVEGESDPSLSREARSLRGTLGAARADAGLPARPAPGSDPAGRTVGALIGELERYFGQFFEQHQEPEYRLATIFIAANVQFGVGRRLAAMLEPGHIAELMGEAMKIALITGTLQRLGPLGRIAGTAYQAHLNSQGVSEVAALISIAAFLRNASQASGFNGVRAWSYMARNIADDAAELFESLVSTPVTGALAALAESASSSPRDLADACRPMMQDPASRAVLLEGVEARIAELEAQGASRDRSDPEHGALLSFRDELMGISSTTLPEGVDPTMALPGQQSESAATDFFAAGRQRSPEQRAELETALGDLQGQVPLIENPTLAGSTVHVRYEGGQLRIEAGPGAEARHVRAHVETARQLQRYHGVVGMVRRLIDRIRNRLQIGSPGHGSRGFESQLEVRKLESMIRELEQMQAQVEARAQRLSGEADLAASRAEQQAIAREITSLREQAAEHAAELDSYEAGRGFIAAEDRHAPTPQWLATLRASLTPAAQAQLDQLSASGPFRSDPERLRTMLESRPGGPATFLESKASTTAAVEALRTALTASRSQRMEEARLRLGDDFVGRRDIADILARGDIDALRGKIAEEIARRRTAARFDATAGHRTLTGLKLYELVPGHATTDSWVAARTAQLVDEGQSPAEAAVQARREGSQFTELNGALYVKRGEADIMVVRDDPAGGRAQVVHLEEVKSGASDSPSRARSQLVSFQDGLARIAAGDTTLMLRGGATDFTSQIDAGSAGGASLQTTGPLAERPQQAGDGFDANVGLTITEITQLAQALTDEAAAATTSEE